MPLGYSASSLRPAGPPTSESEDAGRSPVDDVDARTWPWDFGRPPAISPCARAPRPCSGSFAVVSLALQGAGCRSML